MNHPLKCTLIISLYNQAKQLPLVLESALVQTERSFEIVLADDGSSDGTAAYIEQFKADHPEVPLKFVTQADDGFRKTLILNAAVKLATTPYLVVVDGDMILHHRFIEMHLKHAHPQRIMCGWRGCKIKEPLAKRLINREETFSTKTLSVLWRGLKGQMISPLRTTIIENKLLRKIICKERHHVGGCNFGLHKENYELCNGMDESILRYGYEDIEFGQRLKNNGVHPIGIRNCANTYHLEHGKSANPNIKSVLVRIAQNTAKQCQFGLKQLESGSTNDDFFE